MNDTTIHIEDFTPVVNETKLMPCQSCGMLQYFNLSNMNSAGEMLEENFNSSSFVYTCITCFENYALAQQVHDMQQTIEALQNRISSLVNLRDSENSFDRTVMGALTNQFTNLNIHQNVPLPASHVVIEGTTKSTLATSDHTSIWIGESDADVETISTINNDTINSYDHFVETSSEPITSSFANSSIQETTEPNTGSSITPDPISDPTTTLIQSTDLDSQIIRNSNDQCITSTTNTGSETIIIGDSWTNGLKFKNISLLHSVNYPSAKIENISKVLDHLSDKYKSVKTFIVHAGENDIKYGKKTEEIKQSFHLLHDRVCSLNKRLMISGPIPTTNCSSQHFSRLAALNEWLLKWCHECCIEFVNNFDIHWAESGYLNDNAKVSLNLKGKETFAKHIEVLITRTSTVDNN